MKKKPMVKKTFKNVLITSYIVLLSFMLAIGIVSIYYIRQTYENGSEIYTQTLKSIEILETVDQNIKETDQYIFSMTTELDKENHKDYVNHINRLMDDTAYMVKEYQNIPVSEKEKDRFTRCYYDILGYNRLINQIIEKNDFIQIYY